MINKEKICGSEAVMKVLLLEGVEVIFGYPGGAIMPIYDLLYKYNKEIRHILTRHEQGAIHTAQAYARTTSKIGICFATSGPGGTNLITGLADAMLDSTPVICITGQVFSSLLGKDAFQESDIVGISIPITKWSFQITKAEEIPSTLAKAFYIAKNDRPGPILIDITKDAQFETFDFLYNKCSFIRSYQPIPDTNQEDILKTAKIINQAKKPFLLAGQGILISKAQKELISLIEKADILIGCTLLGLSSVPTNHPLNKGMLGMHGHYAPNIKTNECDVLIAIGMRFDDRVTGDVKKYAKQAKIIHIEIDPSEVNKIIPSDVTILGDAKDVLKKLIPLVNENKHTEWINSFNDLYNEEFKKVISKDLQPEIEGIRMAEVINLVSQNAKEDAIMVSDVGQHQMLAARYFQFKQPFTNVTSGGAGTMGFAFPASIGAQIGNPNRQVITFIGDGGFQMTIQELGTIMQENLPIKIIILNNNFLGMVRQWQQLFFDRRYSFTHLKNPNFMKIVNGYGIKSAKIERREDLKEAIVNMLHTKQAYVLEVIIETEDNVFPMVPAGAGLSEIILEPNNK